MEEDDSIENISLTTNDEEDAPIEHNAIVSANIERRSTAKSISKYLQLKDDEISETTFSTTQIKDKTTFKKVLNTDNINPVIKTLKFTHFGPMDVRATELEEILDDDDDYEFDQVFRANSDDSHAYGQKPITFLRKVLATVCHPRLLGDNSYPEDVKSRARYVLQGCKGNSIGSVTDPAGIEIIRKHAAKYIEDRDDTHSKWQDVILTAGSSEAINTIIKLIACTIHGKRSGIMLPVPTKKIYLTYTQKYNIHQIGYYLNEENNWSIDIDELNRAYNESLPHCHPRAIIVINPGNPTGQVLTKENIEEIIKFAYDKELLICADEVNQFDIYIDEIEFVSFKKVLKGLGFPYNKMELASFISASTGYLSEGGLRGGLVEFINVVPEVKKLYLKYISTKVCPPILGQVAIEVLVNPPLPEEPSYNEYMQEKENIIKLHQIQATMVSIAINSFSNFTCSQIKAGKYAFPSIEMPPTAILAAEEANQLPDFLYSSQLLEQRGICVAPGSEFGQKENTYHLCISFVFQPDDLNLMLGRFKRYNQLFQEQFLCKCKKKKAPED